jgi:hypothetical protein
MMKDHTNIGILRRFFQKVPSIWVTAPVSLLAMVNFSSGSGIFFLNDGESRIFFDKKNHDFAKTINYNYI